MLVNIRLMQPSGKGFEVSMADNLDKQTNAWSAKELAQDFKGWYAQAVKDQDFNNGYNEKPQLEQQGVAEGDELTHAGQDVMVWTGPPTNNPPRDDKKYWVRGQLDSTEMHGGSMRANVMTAKGMYNPELSRVFNADMSEAYTPSPAKPFRNPPGFNKQGTGVGNKLADLNRDELANIQPSKGTPVPAKKFAQGVLKDLKKVNVKEVKADPAGSWVVYGGSNVMKFKTHGGAKAYAEKNGGKVASSEFYSDKVQKQGVAEAQLDELSPQTLRSYIKKSKGHSQKYDQKGNKADEKGDEELANKMWNKGDNRYAGEVQARAKLAGVDEGQTDYQKRRQRERDVDAGKPVPKQREPRMTDYQKKRAQDKKDMELGEDQDTSAVERAILNRVMVAHTDLLMKFGPEKVMQAAEEVAYNVGDVDEIGTSDVSAYVDQVKQILGVDNSYDDADEFGMPGSEFFPDEKLDEKWSQKYKSSINCANPKGFSQRAHCAGKKK